jgi:ribosomal protein L7/L12
MPDPKKPFDLGEYRGFPMQLHFDGAKFRVTMKQNLTYTAELSDAEMIDLMGFVNTIITHIANGNKNEERLVNVMGGTIIETESEKWVRQGMQQGQAKMIVELGQDDGQDDEAILRKLREKIGLSLEEAKDCLAKYGRQLV